MAKAISKEKRKPVATHLQAAALQLTVVIALLITILLASMLYMFGFFREQDTRIERSEQLLDLLQAALPMAQSPSLPQGESYYPDLCFTGDSVIFQKSNWGLYEQVNIKTFHRNDSLRKSLLLGSYSTDGTVLYVTDEDRNVSISGKSSIIGEAYLPKAGIKPAFVDGQFYQGHEDLVQGRRRDSERTLPAFDFERVQELLTRLQDISSSTSGLRSDSVYSFFDSTQVQHSALPILLDGTTIKGNTILYSDTLIQIGSQASLAHIICIAPVIRVDKGFRGRVQLFATDSLILDESVRLDYPSAIILFPEDSDAPRYLRIGKDSRIQGTVALLEEVRSRKPHRIDIKENVQIYGDLISYGMLQYKHPLTVYGSTYCYRFITQTPRSLYENYLIDLTLDRSKRSPFFLRGFIWKEQQPTDKTKILSWLD